MLTDAPDLAALFAQLGLPATPEAIDLFIERHRGQSRGETLACAALWTPAQATFLREAIAADAEWAEVVDRLDALLR